jgi:hypothetical protein
VTEYLTIAGNTLAFDVTGEGPLVVLAHGMGDSRHSYGLALLRVGACVPTRGSPHTAGFETG